MSLLVIDYVNKATKYNDRLSKTKTKHFGLKGLSSTFFINDPRDVCVN